VIANIEFNLDDVEDRQAFRLMTNAQELLAAVTEWDAKLRQLEKYGADDAKPESWRQIREMWFKHMTWVLSQIEE